MIRLVVGAIVVLALIGVLAPSAAAAAAPAWAQLADPFASPPSQSGIATFGAAGVAVVGNGGTMAVSSNGGATWTQQALPAGTPVQAVAFNDANHSWAVGAGGIIIATSNGGTTWDVPQASGTTVDLRGVAFSDTSHGWAVGAGGTIIATSNGGTTWDVPQGPSGTTVDLSGVTFKDARNGWAVGAGGTVLATSDGGTTWTPQTAPTTQDLAGVAYLGSPRPQWLVGGQAGLLERYVVSSDAWTTDTGPLSADIVSCAAGPGGVAYALSSNGHVERTLSYGAAPLSLTASATALRAGHDVHLTVSSPIRAPGTLLLEGQTGGGSWQRVATWPWDTSPAAPGNVSDEPLSLTRYRLRFVFAGHTAATSDALTVGVRPQISLARTSLSLRKGAVYRLSGRVFPTETGRRVTIWTNRGGTWHQVASGGGVALVHGSSFATRLFGTPVKESYKLQVRMAASAKYLAATSALVKVTIK
jgi:photosystem II stability/assembly factor-like uncharacterized protein